MSLLVPKELKVLKLFVDKTVLLKLFGWLIFFAQNFAHCVVMTVGEIDLWFQKNLFCGSPARVPTFQCASINYVEAGR